MDRRGRFGWPGGPARVFVRLVGGLMFAGLLGVMPARWRGPTLGVLAFAFYGLLLGLGAVAPGRMRRWAGAHLVADASIVVPLMFFLLVLVPGLPWWAAALGAVAFGVWAVPFQVRRRRAYRAWAARAGGD
ncbi:hypothetical protein [Dactylosporangium sp. NPDC051541]|uniref:hypothetical protein n=1 Tax=Dactylosporangium sp. NPDC051541 TaxID=3363977 RepID=UPI003792B619